MTEFAKGLTDAEMLALGQYFEKQEGQPHSVNDADLAALGRYLYQKGNSYSGVPACASCHGPKAYGTPLMPRLAGQHAEYTVRQLKEFNKRTRTNDNAVMHSIASQLTELEARGVAEYLSGLN
jgi:cytochrome c553